MNSSYEAKRRSRDPWWHVVGLFSGLLFVLMLMLARLYPMYLDGIDAVVEHLVTPFQTFSLIEPFLAITVLGSVTGIIITTLGALYLLRRNRFTVLQLVLALASAAASMDAAKYFVERTRPGALLWLDPLSSYSFPSGHATLCTTLYGFFAVSLYRRIRNPILRLISVAACLLIIFLICLSRLVLNYHYATDVTAGVLLGIFWLAVIFMMPKRHI